MKTAVDRKIRYILGLDITPKNIDTEVESGSWIIEKQMHIMSAFITGNGDEHGTKEIGQVIRVAREEMGENWCNIIDDTIDYFDYPYYTSIDNSNDITMVQIFFRKDVLRFFGIFLQRAQEYCKLNNLVLNGFKYIKRETIVYDEDLNPSKDQITMGIWPVAN